MSLMDGGGKLVGGPELEVTPRLFMTQQLEAFGKWPIGR